MSAFRLQQTFGDRSIRALPSNPVKPRCRVVQDCVLIALA
jgi:hypothetical protein